jgi:hypothetical protein
VTTPVSPPVAGRWAWREYLPESIDEWLELRNKAIELKPERVDVLRFSDWVLGEMRGEAPPAGSPTLSKYRRLLYELAGEPEPGKPARAKKARKRSVAATRSKVAAGTKGRRVAAIAPERRTAASTTVKRGSDERRESPLRQATDCAT